MNLIREIYSDLLLWKEKKVRKPLLVRGARQVGKTYIVREFGKTFSHYIEINLLDNKNFHALFNRGEFNIDQIVEEISGYFSKPCIPGKTLLFIDEIQACPSAIESLRFFYEKKPDLHVVATGSLLEFALEDIPSFGVGRIENLFMHPLTFREFLAAQGKTGLVEQLKIGTPFKPMPAVLHEAALEEYKKFLLVGGMPEAVARYKESNSLYEISEILENIILGYEDDFRKYAGKIPTERLRETLRSSALQAGKKFIYKHAYHDANSNAVHSALNLLAMAGVVHKVYHTAGNGIPLGAEVELRRFKTLPIDVALYQRLAGVRLQDLALMKPAEMIHKGALIEASVGLELLGYSSPRLRPELFYWHREAKSSNAEVDYVISIDSQIVPLEVKAAKKGSMTSMKIFMSEKEKKVGVRVSSENYSFYQGIVTVPLYAISEIPRIVSALLLK